MGWAGMDPIPRPWARPQAAAGLSPLSSRSSALQGPRQSCLCPAHLLQSHLASCRPVLPGAPAPSRGGPGAGVAWETGEPGTGTRGSQRVLAQVAAPALAWAILTGEDIYSPIMLGHPRSHWQARRETEAPRG